MITKSAVHCKGQCIYFQMDCVEKYLKWIEVNQSNKGPNTEYLIQLHIGHLTHIPFEIFDLIDLKQLDISPDYIQWLSKLFTHPYYIILFSLLFNKYKY